MTANPLDVFVLDRLVQAIPDKFFADPDILGKFQALRRVRMERYTAEMDPVRVQQHIELLIRVSLLQAGDYAELGIQDGVSAHVIWSMMTETSSLYCFDTFEGFDERDLIAEKQLYVNSWNKDSIKSVKLDEVVRTICGESSNSRLKLVQGRVPQTFNSLDNLRLRFAHFDMDLYEPTRQAIPWIWERLVPGGVAVFHDYGCSGFPGVKVAVDDFFRPRGIATYPMGDRHGSEMVFKPSP